MLPELLVAPIVYGVCDDAVRVAVCVALAAVLLLLLLLLLCPRPPVVLWPVVHIELH